MSVALATVQEFSWADSGEADMAACRDALCGGSKSFHAASKLLPEDVRDPAIALYAFCREADEVIDAADGSGSVEWLRERLTLAYAGRPLPFAADRAFARIADRFAIPRALPEALLEGFEWDKEGRRYPDIAAVRAYAVRVAGTVGGMMAVLMGVRDPDRLATAIDLGVAMQLSNIARDVGEDARNGRLYLPLDWMRQEGIDPDAFLAAPAFSPALGRVVARLLQEADVYYERAEAGIARLPVGCRFGIGAARLLYAEIGNQVRRNGMDSVSGRAVVSGKRKLWVLLSGLAKIAVPMAPMQGETVPEGAYLVDAVTRVAPRAEPVSPPWWAVTDRLVWTFELFAKLEDRQRMQVQGMIAGE
jgi:phytoene synthase